MAENVSSVYTNNKAVTMSTHTALIQMNFGLGVWYVCTLLVLAIFGTSGNIFILYFSKDKNSFTSSARKFMANMAIGDLIVSGLVQPTCLVGALGGMETIRRIPGFCEIVGALCITACVCVFLSLFNLTLNRWINVCHKEKYDKIYTRKVTYVLCALPWLIGLVAESPNFFWNGLIFDHKAQRCTWDRMGNKVYTKVVPIVLATLLLIMIALNVLVVKKIYEVKKALASFDKRNRNRFSTVMSSSKILLVMMAVFLFCWAPSVVVLLIDVEDKYPMEAYLILALLAHSHSATPFVVYFCFKRDFRKKLRYLICGSKCALMCRSCCHGRRQSIEDREVISIYQKNNSNAMPLKRPRLSSNSSTVREHTTNSSVYHVSVHNFRRKHYCSVSSNTSGRRTTSSQQNTSNTDETIS